MCPMRPNVMIGIAVSVFVGCFGLAVMSAQGAASPDDQSRIQIGFRYASDHRNLTESQGKEPRLGWTRQLSRQWRWRMQRLPHRATFHARPGGLLGAPKQVNVACYLAEGTLVRSLRLARHHAVGERQTGRADLRTVPARDSHRRGSGQSGPGAARDAVARVPDHERSRSARRLRLPHRDPGDSPRPVRGPERALAGRRPGCCRRDRHPPAAQVPFRLLPHVHVALPLCLGAYSVC